MLSSGQTSIVFASESIQLDCAFHALTYDLFANPTVWIKEQFSETTRVNIMGNLYEPFVSTHRFKSTFFGRPPRYHFGLQIAGIHAITHCPSFFFSKLRQRQNTNNRTSQLDPEIDRIGRSSRSMNQCNVKRYESIERVVIESSQN